MSKKNSGGHASRFHCEIDKEPRYSEAIKIEKNLNRENRNRRKAFRN